MFTFCGFLLACFIDDETLKTCRAPPMIYCCGYGKTKMTKQSKIYGWAELKYRKNARAMFLAAEYEKQTMASEVQVNAHPNMAPQEFTSREIECSKAIGGVSPLKVCCLKPSTFKSLKICTACMILLFLGSVLSFC